MKLLMYHRELQKTYDQVRTDKEAALLDKVRLESLKIQLEKYVRCPCINISSYLI